MRCITITIGYRKMMLTDKTISRAENYCYILIKTAKRRQSDKYIVSSEVGPIDHFHECIWQVRLSHTLNSKRGNFLFCHRRKLQNLNEAMLCKISC